MLDKDKLFGECGANIYGWKYYQDGRYFGSDGNELDAEGKKVEKQDKEGGSKAETERSEPVKTKPIPKPRGRRKSPTTALSGVKK